MKKWNAKKWICLLGLVLTYLPFLCFLLPVYVVKNESEVKVTYYRIADYLTHCTTGNLVYFWVTYGLFFVLMTVAAIFFVKAIRADSNVGDYEDKSYVLGFAFFILGNVIVAITMFGIVSYIPMLWGLLDVAVGIGLLVLHFKKLSVI